MYIYTTFIYIHLYMYIYIYVSGPQPPVSARKRAAAAAARKRLLPSVPGSNRLGKKTGVNDAGSLLGRAGFSLPAVDIDTVTIHFPDAMTLMHALQVFFPLFFPFFSFDSFLLWRYTFPTP